MLELKAGDRVEIFDGFNRQGHAATICTGNVEKVTPTQVVVKNQHGNVVRFHLKNGHILGYAWPYVTHCVRAAK